MREHHDTVVIGGGQAGLAMSAVLQQHGREHVVLERWRVGESLDLRREGVAAIVWATGYDYDYGWLRAPVLDAQGRPLQHRGVSPVPGLYFLGLHWMHTIKSGLLCGVGSDAGYLAEHMDLMAGR
jgi:cation diffusion facilitator CzcD-associated flavoprotein CzcO